MKPLPKRGVVVVSDGETVHVIPCRIWWDYTYDYLKYRRKKAVSDVKQVERDLEDSR